VIVIIGIFHEFGHSIALLKFGEEPGRIGGGVYFVMPVLFSDVTRTWKLKRYQRLIVDAGGMYLQLITLLALFIVNVVFVDNNEIIRLAILLSALGILGNLNPFIRMDGYWVLADILGVANVTQLMMKLLVHPFRKKKETSLEIEQLSRSKKIILIVYMLMTGAFFMYFGSIIIHSMILAYTILSTDIYILWNGQMSYANITISGVFQYLSLRFSSFIVSIFLIRMIWGIFKKIFMTFNGAITQRKEVTTHADRKIQKNIKKGNIGLSN
jgi:putative peptide zinc metalloprotease protein